MSVNILHRVDQSRNMARRYELSVQPGLFGDISVSRHWGRIGTLGKSKEFWFATEIEACEMARRVLKQKRQRGYVSLTDPQPSPTLTA